MKHIPQNHSEAEVDNVSTAERFGQLLESSVVQNNKQVDQLFVWLMAAQYIAGIAIALIVSPQTWIGQTAYVHSHVWFAAIFGAILSGFPVFMARAYPGSVATMHTMAIAQAVWGALLIHLTGGRIETHFHVFGSLAFVAFYRNWKALLTVSLVVAADHAVRGIFWPLSVYGIATESPLRWIEHTVWILMEDVVLFLSCRRGVKELAAVCQNQAELESLNAVFEDKVRSRTLELEASKRNAEQLAMVARHTDNSVLILDTEARIQWLNDGFTRQSGYTLSEVAGKIPIDFLSGPETNPERVSEITEGIASGRGFNLEITTYRKDGTPVILDVETRPICDAAGNVVQFFQIERDVTKLRRDEAEKEALRAELSANSDHLAKLALVAQYTSNAVMITDAEGRIEWVNSGFTRITGHSSDDAVGRLLGTLLHGPETSTETQAQVLASIQQNSSFTGELIQYTKTGQSYWANLQINPAESESDSVRCIAVVTDISERKTDEKEREQLHGQLREAARMAGRAEVATGVLHNVGNVLNSASVSATLIRETLTNSVVTQLVRSADILSQHEADLVQYLTQDVRGVHFPRFVKQVSDSLVKERDSELSEIDSLLTSVEHIREIVASQQSIAGSRRLMEPVQLIETIDQALRINAGGLVRHNVQVLKELEHLPIVEADQHELLQILVNLIKNAKEACDFVSRDSRTLTISACRENDHVRINIADTGIGIREEFLEAIFQHGFSTRVSGNGFGLHSAALSATELGGSLTAHSDGEGLGATFVLRVPIKQRKPRDGQTSRAREVALGHE